MQWSLHNCLGWCENKERNSEWWKIQMMERVGEVFAIGGGNNDMIILQYKWSQVVDRKIQILKIERGQLQLVWGGGNNDMKKIMQIIFVWRGSITIGLRWCK